MCKPWKLNGVRTESLGGEKFSDHGGDVCPQNQSFGETRDSGLGKTSKPRNRQRNRRFESISLQRSVCELSVSCSVSNSALLCPARVSPRSVKLPKVARNWNFESSSLQRRVGRTSNYLSCSIPAGTPSLSCRWLLMGRPSNTFYR